MSVCVCVCGRCTSCSTVPPITLGVSLLVHPYPPAPCMCMQQTIPGGGVGGYYRVWYCTHIVLVFSLTSQSVTASHSCFCSFFTSHPYILSKYLQNVLFTSLYPFFSPNFERAKANNIPIFCEPSVYTNGHGVIIIGV